MLWVQNFKLLKFQKFKKFMATLFKDVKYNLQGLINNIDMGTIGLPDIQRPFVWPDTKVRQLFDSLYKGYPVGYLLFWENANINGIKSI